ncbi:MAG TPA: sensor histidine kinase [Streptosporangiaceae bacterium]|nr:sensor histidine kinase [Streptosporangiaceae bacterium]
MDDPATDSLGGLEHVALIYGSPQELVTAFTEFLEVGMADGAAMIVVATNQIVERLRSARVENEGVALADLTRHGTNPGRILSTLRMFAHQHRDKPVRCLQELAWPGRHPDELAEALNYESVIGDAFATSASMLCAYHARLEAAMVRAVQHIHPKTWSDGRADDSRPGAGAAAFPDDRELSNPPPGAVRLTFRDDQAGVRRFAAALAQRAGLSPRRVTDLVIAVGELAANTLIHTTGKGTLTSWVADGALICQVSDFGQIADPLAGTFRPDPRAAGTRRGLWLVHQVADLVQIRTGPAGTTTRLHMCLPR